MISSGKQTIPVIPLTLRRLFQIGTFLCKLVLSRYSLFTVETFSAIEYIRGIAQTNPIKYHIFFFLHFCCEWIRTSRPFFVPLFDLRVLGANEYFPFLWILLFCCCHCYFSFSSVILCVAALWTAKKIILPPSVTAGWARRLEPPTPSPAPFPGTLVVAMCKCCKVQYVNADAAVTMQLYWSAVSYKQSLSSTPRGSSSPSVTERWKNKIKIKKKKLQEAEPPPSLFSLKISDVSDIEKFNGARRSPNPPAISTRHTRGHHKTWELCRANIRNRKNVFSKGLCLCWIIYMYRSQSSNSSNFPVHPRPLDSDPLFDVRNRSTTGWEGMKNPGRIISDGR